jgi:hypothetical protein
MVQSKHTSLRLKANIRALADQLCELEHRDLTNLIEIAIIEYGRHRGITLPVVAEDQRGDERS